MKIPFNVFTATGCGILFFSTVNNPRYTIPNSPIIIIHYYIYTVIPCPTVSNSFSCFIEMICFSDKLKTVDNNIGTCTSVTVSLSLFRAIYISNSVYYKLPF